MITHISTYLQLALKAQTVLGASARTTRFYS